MLLASRLYQPPAPLEAMYLVGQSAVLRNFVVLAYHHDLLQACATEVVQRLSIHQPPTSSSNSYSSPRIELRILRGKHFALVHIDKKYAGL